MTDVQIAEPTAAEDQPVGDEFAAAAGDAPAAAGAVATAPPLTEPDLAPPPTPIELGAVTVDPYAWVPRTAAEADGAAGPADGAGAAAVAVAPAASGGADVPEAAAAAEPPKRRRRRLALLAFLGLMAGGLLLFSGWYLMTRKPISELPLPGLSIESTPSYSTSIYGITRPTGIAVTADGSRIYVTQSEGTPQVDIFDSKGTQVGTITPPPDSTGDHVPVYVAIDPKSGDVYVSDRPTASIYVYSADGTYRRTFDPGPTLKGWQPLGLSFDKDGNFLVTDVSGPANRVHEFANDGSLTRTVGQASQFSFPNGVTVDDAGNFYVADSNNGRLVVFDPSGQQLAVVRRGPAAGDLGMPRGTAIDDRGRVYVVDTTGQTVKVYHSIKQGDITPAYIGQFGVEGTTDGAFGFPNGIAVDTRARVYVADWNNNRVQIWSY
jgi:DNA-binding beta-propeller fold protein YncE